VSSSIDAWKHRRPLMKDPIALYSAEWLADTYQMDVVVMIRHPAAFVASVKRLDWQFDFHNLLRQEALIQNLLPEFREQIETYSASPPSIIDMAIAQWRMAYTLAERYRERHPDWHFIRHEDLSLDPINRYHEVCSKLSIPWSPKLETYLLKSTSASNPVITAEALDTNRDSRNVVRAWTTVLSLDEVRHIRQQTEPLASQYYGDDEW
jgi:hypothetical protein